MSYFVRKSPHLTNILKIILVALLYFWQGQVVAVRFLKKKNVEITRNVRKELHLMKEMAHDNITRFIGACVDPGNICMVTQFCARGSLKVSFIILVISLRFCRTLMHVKNSHTKATVFWYRINWIIYHYRFHVTLSDHADRVMKRGK